MEKKFSEYFVKIVMGEFPNNNTYRSLGLCIGVITIILFPLAIFIRILPGLIKISSSNNLYPLEKCLKKIAKYSLPWILGILVNTMFYIPLIEKEKILALNIFEAYLFTLGSSILLSTILLITVGFKYINLINK